MTIEYIRKWFNENPVPRPSKAILEAAEIVAKYVPENEEIYSRVRGVRLPDLSISNGNEKVYAWSRRNAEPFSVTAIFYPDLSKLPIPIGDKNRLQSLGLVVEIIPGGYLFGDNMPTYDQYTFSIKVSW